MNLLLLQPNAMGDCTRSPRGGDGSSQEALRVGAVWPTRRWQDLPGTITGESCRGEALWWHSANFRSLSCLLMMLFAAVPQAEGAAVAVVSFDDVEVKLREEGAEGAGASHR